MQLRLIPRIIEYFFGMSRPRILLMNDEKFVNLFFLYRLESIESSTTLPIIIRGALFPISNAW